MKYDVLHSFRDQLAEEPLSENTKKQYYAFVKKVLGSLMWNNPAEIDPAAVENALAQLKTASDVSAARNGLLLFCRCYPDCKLEKLPTGKELHKRNHAKRHWDPLKLSQVKRKINGQPRGERLAYRVMLATGMRVSEAAGLRPSDISTFTDDKGQQQMRFMLQHTKKGGSDIAYTADAYLLAQLPLFLEGKSLEAPLFPSCQTLKNKATKCGFECHDLRRAFAQKTYDRAKQEMPRDEAVETVRKELRHSYIRTTKRYLRRKIVK